MGMGITFGGPGPMPTFGHGATGQTNSKEVLQPMLVFKKSLAPPGAGTGGFPWDFPHNWNFPGGKLPPVLSLGPEDPSDPGDYAGGIDYRVDLIPGVPETYVQTMPMWDASGATSDLPPSMLPSPPPRPPQEVWQNYNVWVRPKSSAEVVSIFHIHDLGS